MSKRILALVLAVVCLVSLLPVTASAATVYDSPWDAVEVLRSAVKARRTPITVSFLMDSDKAKKLDRGELLQVALGNEVMPNFDETGGVSRSIEDAGNGKSKVTYTYNITYTPGSSSRNYLYADSVEEGMEALYDAMVARQPAAYVFIPVETEVQGDALHLDGFIEEACNRHIGPKEGDYVFYGELYVYKYGGSYTAATTYSYLFESYVARLEYVELNYFTTQAQEQKVDTEVSKLLDQLDLWNASDYDKIKGVYDWVCSHVTYAYDSNGDPAEKYSIYNALIERSSVCQGYAMLVYRLLQELGVECRIDVGQNHAWNYVELNGKWYLLDATWDAGKTNYKWFLKGRSNFGDHISERAVGILSTMDVSSTDYQQGNSNPTTPSNPTNPTTPSNPTDSSNPFVDVAKGQYYYDSVLWAVGNDITNGVDATHFRPNDRCTRGQVVTFLWRAAGSPEPTSSANPFSDVRSSAYYYKAVLWAVENGITSGTSATRFSPGDYCTRGQVVTFLWRTEGRPGVSGSSKFNDVRTTDYYYDAVRWAVANGITNGTSATQFSPAQSCTRGQIVTFLHRTFA